MKLLIIADVHGRTFWKAAIEKHLDEVDKIIFLGDYLDSYPHENITRKEAINNFQEIIDFKEQNKDKVILLLGNHDLPYWDKRNYQIRSRYDSSNAYHIEEMFRSHRSFFKLAHEEILNEKKYLFTHAGLTSQWYNYHKPQIGELTVENLNKLDTPNGMRILAEASAARGGWNQFGSFVWNDVTDCYEGINDNLPWDYQVFGHTQLREQPIITKEYACLDCRKAFLLLEEGGFQEA